METDVVIIGAGPVGNYLAHSLLEKGVQVLLVEEHKELGRPFQCAGLVTPNAMDKVGLHSTILTSVWGARIHSPGGNSVEVGGPNAIKTHVVCRKLFDEGVGRLAIDSGAEIWLDSRPIFAESNDEGISLTISKGNEVVQVTASLLCGADGAHSWVRRYFKMGNPKEMMVGFQVELTGYQGVEGRLDMFTGDEVAPGLFAWAIPSGRSWRIGVWSRPNDLNGRSCEDLYHTLRNHPIWAHRFKDSVEVARYCGPLPCGVVHQPVKQRVALFGDAVGLCKPTTGGGIGKGFTQVDLMIDDLVKGIKANKLSESDLKKIAKPLSKMKKDQKRARVLRDLFLTNCTDLELEETFKTFNKPEILAMINEHGDIEHPVKLGIKMLKEVPEFRKIAVGATWALLKG